MSHLGHGKIHLAETFAGRKVHHFSHFGHHPAVVTSLATVWGCGGLYPWATTWDAGVDTNLTLVSSDAADAVGGAGVITVRVYGLGGDGLEKQATVTLSGTNSVSVAGTWSFIQNIRASTAGATGAAVGTVTAKYNDTSTISCIGPADTESESSIFRVPSDCEGFLYRFILFVAPGDKATVTLRVRAPDDGGLWRTIMHPIVAGSLTVFQEHPNEPFMQIDRDTDVEVIAISDNGSGSDVSCRIAYKLFRVGTV